MTLPEGSPSVGRAVYELRLPADSVIVAILREGHVVIPQPETVLAAGDEVLALASAAVERDLRDAVVGADMPGGVPTDSIDGESGVRVSPGRGTRTPRRSPPAGRGRVRAAGRAGSRTPQDAAFLAPAHHQYPRLRLPTLSGSRSTPSPLLSGTAPGSAPTVACSTSPRSGPSCT